MLGMPTGASLWFFLASIFWYSTGRTVTGFVNPRFSWIQYFPSEAFPQETQIFGGRQRQRQKTFSTAPPSTACIHTALMGVRGFRAWFESQFPEAVRAVSIQDSHETFDHVLIDVNPILHVCLRKSRSDEHSLVLLMKELDRQLLFATPSQSLVLAMDGPPGAAKLSTQRKRRFQTVVRSQTKINRIDKLLQSDSPMSQRALRRIKSWKRKRSQLVADLRTLRLTPGTDYMALAEQAVLYWAWQRLQARTTRLSQNNVAVFVSASTSPDEGEVKLLDWIYHKPRRGESIAIIGGDSDLVLEALVVPVASTHNIFVLLPEGKKHSLSVSIWETTRSLAKLLHHNSIQDMIRVRSDVALLLIMTGNDYLPKVRGCGGFNNLFRSYTKIHRRWEDRSAAYLVDPATLAINLDFAIALFELLSVGCHFSYRFRNHGPGVAKAISPLAKLNNLVEANFLPSPYTFYVVEDDDGDGQPGNATEMSRPANADEAEDEADDDDDATELDDDETDGDDFDLVSEPNDIRVRLVIGKEGSDDFYSYEIRHPVGTSMKKARLTLAAMALTDLLDQEEDSDSDDDSSLEDDLTAGVVDTYAWHLHYPVKGDVGMYLYGLLWNLQTYQTGRSTDYGFNYGRRMAPSSEQIVDFLKQAKEEGRTITPNDLQQPSSPTPFSAGISCVAALPSLLNHLVPLPYRELSPELVEDFYGACMDPETNTFDFNEFERLCNEQLDEMGLKAPPFEGYEWTTIYKSQMLKEATVAPKPFCDRFNDLGKSRYLKIKRFSQEKGRTLPSADPGPFLSSLGAVERVDYRLAFQCQKEKKGNRSRKNKPIPKAPASKQTQKPATIPTAVADGAATKKNAQPATGGTSTSLLQILADVKLIEFQWTINAVGETEGYERIRLTIQQGPVMSTLDIPDNCLVLEAQRHGQGQTRKNIKSILATQALDELTGTEDWRTMSVGMLKAQAKM